MSLFPFFFYHLEMWTSLGHHDPPLLCFPAKCPRAAPWRRFTWMGSPLPLAWWKWDGTQCWASALWREARNRWWSALSRQVGLYCQLSWWPWLQLCLLYVISSGFTKYAWMRLFLPCFLWEPMITWNTIYICFIYVFKEILFGPSISNFSLTSVFSHCCFENSKLTH